MDDDILPENAWGEDDSWSSNDEEEDRTSFNDTSHTKETNKDEYENDDKDGIEFGAQHVLILIDCHWSMFNNNNNNNNNNSNRMEPFDAALCAVNELLKLRIQHVATTKSGKRDGVGVLFFGTRPQKSTKKTTYLWMPLEPPGTSQVLHLANYLQSSTCSNRQQRDLLEQEFASPRDEEQKIIIMSTLRLALLESHDIFQSAKCVRTTATATTYDDTTTLWIFTNQDDPCHGNNDERKQLTKIAHDVLQNGIDIQLFPLPKCCWKNPCCNTTFDRTLFYNTITSPNRYYLEDQDDQSTFNLHFFLNQIQKQTKQHRPIRGVRLLFPDTTTTTTDYGIALELYRLVQVQRKPGYEWVTNATNKVVIQETNMIVDSSSAEFVTRQNKNQILRTYIPFGECRIPFTKEDVVQTIQRHTGGKCPCLLLLGFQPNNTTTTSSWYKQQLNRSYLAYPNEDDAPGSKLAFAALHAAMYRKGVVGIGELSILRSSSSTSCSVPRLVRIIPQPEKRQRQSPTSSQKTVQIEPPGWILTPLPYEDDIRTATISERACTTASDETVTTMKELIVAQQTSQFVLDEEDEEEDLEYFSNPALTKFWNYIEAVALTQPVAEFVDETEMERNVPVYDERRLELVRKLQRLLPDEEDLPNNKKRKAAGSTRINSNEDGMLDFEQMLKDGTLDNCTNAVLKGYLQSVGLPQTGTKKVLLERIAASIECPYETQVKQEFPT